MLFGPHAAPTSKMNSCNHYRRVLINGYTTTGAKNNLYLGAGLSKMLGD